MNHVFRPRDPAWIWLPDSTYSKIDFRPRTMETKCSCSALIFFLSHNIYSKILSLLSDEIILSIPGILLELWSLWMCKIPIQNKNNFSEKYWPVVSRTDMLLFFPGILLCLWEAVVAVSLSLELSEVKL